MCLQTVKRLIGNGRGILLSVAYMQRNLPTACPKNIILFSLVEIPEVLRNDSLRSYL